MNNAVHVFQVLSHTFLRLARNWTYDELCLSIQCYSQIWQYVICFPGCAIINKREKFCFFTTVTKEPDADLPQALLGRLGVLDVRAEVNSEGPIYLNTYYYMVKA